MQKQKKKEKKSEKKRKKKEAIVVHANLTVSGGVPPLLVPRACLARRVDFMRSNSGALMKMMYGQSSDVRINFKAWKRYVVKFRLYYFLYFKMFLLNIKN